MRTVPAKMETALANGAMGHFAMVAVDSDGGGTFVGLDNFFDTDWQRQITLEDSIDSSCEVLTVELSRARELVSLNPLIQYSAINQLWGSYVPVITTGRAIQLYVSTLPYGQVPTLSADWTLRFSGMIDELDPGGRDNTLRIAARDLGGTLIDQCIEEQRVYGAVAGVSVESQMQQILTDNSTGVTLYVPTSPSWNVLQWAQAKKGVLVALRELADQLGWQCRYRWDAGTSAFRLTLFTPDRAKTTPDRTITNRQYAAIDSLKLSLAGRRNAVQVVYTDATGTRQKVTVTNATAIARDGRRWCEIAEDSNGNISTSTEANKYAQAICDDLSEAIVVAEVPMRVGFWPAEIRDLYRFAADGVYTDADLDLAVTAVKHVWAKGDLKTSLTVGGKVAGAYKNWHRRIHQTGSSETDPSKNNDEVGTGDSSQAQPNNGSVPTRGSHYHDPHGTGAGMQDGESASGVQNKNQGFGSQSREARVFAPDGWYVGTGAYGWAADVTVNTSTNQGGGCAAELRATATAVVELVSALFPVTAGVVYTARALLQGNSTDVADTHKVLLRYYRVNKTTQVGPDVELWSGRATGSSWGHIPQVDSKAPPTARWACLVFQKGTN